MMDRRTFGRGLLGTAAMPQAVRAQQAPVRGPVIGFLNSASPAPFAPYYTAFIAGLAEGGFADGQNVRIEQRWGEGDYARLPALVAELIERGVALIVASGGTPAVQAAKTATTTIPVVFVTGGDPVKDGLVASLASPGGNLTGITQFSTLLQEKRLGILHEALPGMRRLAVLSNPGFPSARVQYAQALALGPRLGIEVLGFEAETAEGIETAYRAIAAARPDALLVATDPFFNSRRARLATLAAERRLPAMYEFRQFVDAGGLMSYGTSLTDAYRQSGVYAARVLKGARPAELPVLQSATFELVINLQTARALGLTLPPSILLRADEVIE